METIIEALKQVPEVRLQIIKLAWQVTGEDGSLDVTEMLLHSKELGEAISEAAAYSSATKEAVSCLREIARSEY